MTIGEEKMLAKTFARFEERYIPEPNSGCWIWVGFFRRGQRGERGEVSFRGCAQLAHRVAWQLFRSPIPDKIQVLHSCDVACCVNPEHLYLGTHIDNMRDMRVRRRSFMARQPDRCTQVLKQAQQFNVGNTRWCGERHWKVKLTKEQVEKIRIDPRNNAQIAKEYGVYRSTIRDIKLRKTWRK